MRAMLLLLFSFVLLVPLIAEETERMWQTKMGGKLEAVWDRTVDTGGEVITLLKGEKKYRVNLNDLTEGDREYVESKNHSGFTPIDEPETGFTPVEDPESISEESTTVPAVEVAVEGEESEESPTEASPESSEEPRAGEREGTRVVAALPKEYVNSQGQRLKLIPAGEFQMGDTLTAEEAESKYGGESSWYEDAHPRHKVKISRPYYMGEHEVTVGEYRKFVTSTGYETTAEKEGTAYGLGEDGVGLQKGLKWSSPGFDQGETHPVTCVSWYDAEAYIAWLNKEDPDRPAGYKYALPSEAQWEYACRAGSATSFYWGEDERDGEGYLNGMGEEWFPDGEHSDLVFPFNDGYTATSPVGSYKANAWGLYDMLGNVFEWCQDWYDEEYYGKSPETDPRGPASGSSRVNRGGCWLCDAGFCRSASRDRRGPGDRSSGLGFRLSLVGE